MMRHDARQATWWIAVRPPEGTSPLWRRMPQPLRASALALLLAALLTILLLALRSQMSVANCALLFLLPVLSGAALGGLISGVVAAVACTIALDVFFIKPYGTLVVANAQDVLTLALYLAGGALMAELSGHARGRVQEAARRAATNALLYDLSSALLGGDLDTVLHTLVARLGETFALRACTVLISAPDGDLRGRATWGTPPAAADHEQRIWDAARWAATHGKSVQLTIGAGRSAEQTIAPADAPELGTAEETVLLLPLRSGIATQPLGVLALTRSGHATVRDEERRLLESFAAHAALAVERARLVEQSAAATVLRESDRAKSALLANVSHDLRTPLTTIRGAAESLLQADLTFDGVTREELLTSIRDEADRLSALVGNLLSLARLEAGALRPDRHLYDLAEIACGVIARMRPRLAHHLVRTAIDPATPLVWVDYVLIEQVVVNLLGNAATFAPEGTTITISIEPRADQVLLSVQDQGPGIPRDARAQVFERFYRLPNARSRRVPGTGLGLAICRAVAVAHEGRIWIDDADGGALVRLALPAHATYAGDPGPAQAEGTSG